MINNEICLLNDSFPPLIDGVANTVVNYARVLKQSGYGVSVVTPNMPEADDTKWDYPVIRYPSIDLRASIGYPAGNPFSAAAIRQLKQRDIGILHSHCPMISGLLARQVRETVDVPYILTYHTKFDIDIDNAIKLKFLRAGAVKALVDNVSACDELWVVSEGAGKNIQKLGYQGDYVIMENGVDMPRHRVSDDEIAATVSGYDLPDGVPVFLFVGRIMWYKGLRIILDALAALKSQELDFRMVLIGGGTDEEEIRKYVEEMRLGDKVIFTGRLSDREKLAAWYCRADLFLFPSTFDTNGLVVREAAACSLGSVLIKDSCAAEGTHNGVDCLQIEENAASLAVCLARIMDNKQAMRRIGCKASENLYYSWDDSVHHAMERYEIVLDNHACGRYREHRQLSDGLFEFTGELIDIFSDIEERTKNFRERIDRFLD